MTKRVACGFVALSLAMTSLLGQNYTGEITHEDQRFEAVVGDWQNFYGSAVAVDGNWAVVGEHNKWRGGDSGDAHVGAVHFFERTPRGWVERQTVTPLDANRSDQFGRPVAISGDTAVVGVPNHDNGAISTGAVYVYTLANGVWSQTQKLEVRPHSSGFGLGIGLHGDSLIVGAPGDSLVAHWWGIAYAYERIAGTWTLVQVIQPEGFRPDLYSDLHFGYQVSLHGDLAMISTWDRDGHPGWTFGYGRQVVAYERIAGVWVQKEVIGDPAPFDPNSGAYDFGISTALSDGVLAVGAPRPSGFYPRNGKVSVFERQVDGSWLSTQELESSQP
ncbi:MAG: hypothetical protein GY930_22640, partial [bacterium]|nr:hypothetical protein [bacterium]